MNFIQQALHNKLEHIRDRDVEVHEFYILQLFDFPTYRLSTEIESQDTLRKFIRAYFETPN